MSKYNNIHKSCERKKKGSLLEVKNNARRTTQDYTRVDSGVASDLLLDRIRKCCTQIAMHKHALKFERVIPEALGQTETQIRVAHAKIELELGVVAVASVH